MNELKVALANTPIWVYLLLAYLIWNGIKATKTRTLSLKSLFIRPIIFTCLSIQTLLTSFDISLFLFSAWLCSILFGVMFGGIDTRRHHPQIEVNKEKQLIQVPGSWMTLILVFIFFATKFYFSYEISVDPTLGKQTWFEVCMLAVSGVCAGLFIGRLLSYLYIYSKKLG